MKLRNFERNNFYNEELLLIQSTEATKITLN